MSFYLIHDIFQDKVKTHLVKLDLSMWIHGFFI